MQTLHGLTYLHWRGIVHCDLKPGNLILARDLRQLRIGDFGSAVRLPGLGPPFPRLSGVPGRVASPDYAGPEVSERGLCCTASDVWSVGVTFREVLCAATAAAAEGADGGAEEEGFPEHAALLGELAELLRREPRARPLAGQLAQRPRNYVTLHQAAPLGPASRDRSPGVAGGHGCRPGSRQPHGTCGARLSQATTRGGKQKWRLGWAADRPEPPQQPSLCLGRQGAPSAATTPGGRRAPAGRALAASASLLVSRSTKRRSRKAAQHWLRKRASRRGSGSPCVSSSSPKTKPCTCCKREEEMWSIVLCVGERPGPKNA